MAKQTINIGSSPNDGTGTPLRTSFDYCNLNFTELYTAVGPSGNNIVCPGAATITGAATVGTTLGVTGVATFAAGTALLPALTTTGDTNTGIYYPAADTFAVTAGGSERFRIDSSGNVGIGVTPSAWNSAVKAMQANVASVANNGPTTWFGSNVFYDSTYTAKYITTSFAGSIIYNPLGFGGWDFNIAASGTAGTAITFSTPMKLDGLGNLILQTPSTPPTLATNGQLTVNATSNTNLRFSYRGSDGVTRVANITLA